MNPITRKLDYFTRVFYQNEYAKELRMGNMGALLQEDYEQTAEGKIACAKKCSEINRNFAGVGADYERTV